MHDARAEALLIEGARSTPAPCFYAGIATVEGLVYATSKELGAIKGISEQKVTKLKEIGGCCTEVFPSPALVPNQSSTAWSNAAQKVIPTGFTTAQQIFEQRSELLMVTTGCQALNDILGGGLETGSITELFGEYRCGKTQVR